MSVRILITDAHGHDLPRLTMAAAPRPGDEIALLRSDGTRTIFDVVRVVWSVPDPSSPKPADDFQLEDAVVIVRPHDATLGEIPYR